MAIIFQIGTLLAQYVNLKPIQIELSLAFDIWKPENIFDFLEANQYLSKLNVRLQGKTACDAVRQKIESPWTIIQYSPDIQWMKIAHKNPKN